MQDQRGVADSYQIQEFDSAVDKIEKAGAKVLKSIPLMKPTPELDKILGRVAHIFLDRIQNLPSCRRQGQACAQGLSSLSQCSKHEKP